jgi:hypothetical protein
MSRVTGELPAERSLPMKRLWVGLFLLLALSGCRRSQQATNPFLRTTVPPPGTGAGAVVVPGDPYYPGATTAPPAVTTTPVVAPTAPPPTAAPQAVVPPRELKRDPPGGDYFYHQSSVDGGEAAEGLAAADDSSQPTAIETDMAAAVNAAGPGALRLGGESDAIEQAVALASADEPVEQVSFDQTGGRLPGEELSDDHQAVAAARPKRGPIAAPRPVHTVGAKEAEIDEATLEELPDESSLARALPRRSVA